MWLIVTLIATIIAAAASLSFKAHRERLKLGLLALMLLGTFLMVLVDHIMAFLSGEPFIEVTTDGLIASGTTLGLAMITPILMVWTVAVVAARYAKAA